MAKLSQLASPANPANPAESSQLACDDGDATCLETACRRGQADACTHLAAILEREDHADADLGRAFGTYERACAMGDWTGCGELGRFYAHGLVVPRDFDVARQLFRWACSSDNASACVSAGHMLAEGLGGSRQVEVAETMFSDACDAGSAEGCRKAADLVVDRSSGRGTELFSKACELDDGLSCVRLARIHLGESRAPKHNASSGADDRIAELYHRACDADYADGCKEGSDRFVDGDGVDVDRKVGAELAAKACRTGSSSHCWAAADAYRLGHGVDADHPRAQKLIEAAIDGYRDDCHNDSSAWRACMNAAHALAHGYPKKKRLEEARDLLNKACDDGAEDACREIAFQRISGEIFPVDRERGIASMTQMCDDGDPFVCARLAEELTFGAQTEADLERAYQLHNKNCYWRSNSRGCASYGQFHMRGHATTKDAATAYRHASRACNDDDAVGCPAAAEAMLRRSPDEESDETLVKTLEKLCVYGSKDVACTPLARMYEGGFHGKRDTYRALSLYERVCDADAFYSPEACSRAKLVRLAHKREDQLSSGAKSKSSLEKACKGGDASGCVALARHQEFGTFDADRFSAALSSYRKACDLGNADACTVYIATAYEEGSLWGPKLRAELQWACQKGTARMCSKWGRLMGSHRWELAVTLNQQACQKGYDEACRFLQVNLEAREGVVESSAGDGASSR
jgi:TPR repeat protein